MWLKPFGASWPAIRLAPGDTRTVGRSTQAQIVIDDASLSRLHARVTAAADGGFTVEDLGSTNGVLVGGRRQQIAHLSPGDRVSFGMVDYEAREEEPIGSSVAGATVLRTTVSTLVPPSVDRVALEALLATSRELMACDDVRALLERVLDRLQAILEPDRAAILLLDAVTGELRARAVRPAGAYTSISEFASTTVVREAIAERQAVVIADARVDPRAGSAESVMFANVRSILCVPLLGRTGPVGALYADYTGFRHAVTPHLVDYAAAFAAHAAAAIETAQLYEDRERHFRATLESFARAIDARDRYTAGHSERVTAYSLVLARSLGLSDEECETIRRAAMLHDVGKVGVPDAVLLKAGPLDPDERATMEAHVVVGCRMLAPLPFFEPSLPGMRGHHERWDGGGYPDRLPGARIPRHARLMAVADGFDAMTSARPYRPALAADEAARRIHADRGRQFDPEMVDLFDAVEEQFAAVHRSAASVA